MGSQWSAPPIISGKNCQIISRIFVRIFFFYVRNFSLYEDTSNALQYVVLSPFWSKTIFLKTSWFGTGIFFPENCCLNLVPRWFKKVFLNPKTIWAKEFKKMLGLRNENPGEVKQGQIWGQARSNKIRPDPAIGQARPGLIRSHEVRGSGKVRRGQSRSGEVKWVRGGQMRSDEVR